MSEVKRGIIEEYLQEVETHLPPGTGPAKGEFLREIRAHLEEALADSECPTEAEIRNTLERFGEPVEIAQSFAEEMQEDPRMKPPASHPPSWLVILLVVVLWPIGIILTWLSPAWQRRDKIIVTVVPLILLSVLLLGGTATYHSYTVVSTDQVHELEEVRHPGPPEVVSPAGSIVSFVALVLMLVLIGSPLFCGIYLAIQRIEGQ